jgi:hypothetical protein
VRRAFAGVDLPTLDPFVHMDQMGEVDDAPGEPKGTPWHPHRGFETVTYMIDGIFQHQDSNGGGGLITDMEPVGADQPDNPTIRPVPAPFQSRSSPRRHTAATAARGWNEEHAGHRSARTPLAEG